jgi:N-formylglutamate amidohydrolase
MRKLFEFRAAQLPLLVSVPHAGTLLPGTVASRLSTAAGSLPDTDWFVDLLYDWVTEIGAGLIAANYSRYVIDLNRPPDNSALYLAGTPGLVPLRTFSGEPVYETDAPPADEVQRRLSDYWQPYHHAIEKEIDRLRDAHGYAILFDAHSIRSQVPLLFDGSLPDLSLGSFDRRSAAPGLIETASAVLRAQTRFSHVIDGRFKGGYITRHYGRPEQDVHALQLEMSQSVYMNQEPPEYDIGSAPRVRKFLKILLSALLDWSPARG